MREWQVRQITLRQENREDWPAKACFTRIFQSCFSSGSISFARPKAGVSITLLFFLKLACEEYIMMFRFAECAEYSVFSVSNGEGARKGGKETEL